MKVQYIKRDIKFKPPPVHARITHAKAVSHRPIKLEPYKAGQENGTTANTKKTRLIVEAKRRRTHSTITIKDNYRPWTRPDGHTLTTKRTKALTKTKLTTTSTTTNNNNNINATIVNKATTPDATKAKLPQELLNQISDRLLEHSKQLGIFDDFRINLLGYIESYRDYSDIKREFASEVDSFCRHKANLDEPRSKLRQQFNDYVQDAKSSNLTRCLGKNIEHVVQRHKEKMLADYREKVGSYLDKFVDRSKQAKSTNTICNNNNSNTLNLSTCRSDMSPIVTPTYDQPDLDLDQIPLPPDDDDNEELNSITNKLDIDDNSRSPKFNSDFVRDILPISPIVIKPARTSFHDKRVECFRERKRSPIKG